MISINMITPLEMQKAIAKKACELRLSQNLSQKTLSQRSGVSYGTLKKFEHQCCRPISQNDFKASSACANLRRHKS